MELSRQPAEVVVRKTQRSHFWLGHFPNEQRVAGYFEEVWDQSDEDQGHTPLSAFARDQGEKWYDHDFLEYGYNPDARSIEQLVTGYSYYEQWAAELARRAAAAGVTGSNTVAFIGEAQIAQPRSVEGDDYSLHYVGTIEYRI